MSLETHIEFDDSITRLALDSYATTDGRECRHVKVVGHGFGGRHTHGGPITDQPWCSLIQSPTVLTASGDGMSDFRNVPHLSDGDRVFVEHYGWRVVNIDDRGYTTLIGG
jgi:hypothetical protein